MEPPTSSSPGSVSRRDLIRSAAGAVLAALPASGKPLPPLALGVVKWLGDDPEPAIDHIAKLGFRACMPAPPTLDLQYARRLKSSLEKHDIAPVALVTLGPGEMVWDFLKGPSTIGLVPRKHRRARIDHLKRAGDFAKTIAAHCIQTHCGFIPEDPADPAYPEVVAAVREIAIHYKALGIDFNAETGQETPITLKRAIEDTGLDNVFAGLDTANVILYGKAHPYDAIEVLGPLIRSVHAKDGIWPKNVRQLGEETPIGRGRVGFERVLPRLYESGYRGAIVIEREIEGDRQVADILESKKYLEKIIAGILERGGNQ
jgi:sugar phosphate isomerase/epimerase